MCFICRQAQGFRDKGAGLRGTSGLATEVYVAGITGFRVHLGVRISGPGMPAKFPIPQA